MKEIESLRQIRKRRGISVETMSKEIGVCQMTLIRWLSGKNKPSMMALKRLDEYIHQQVYGKSATNGRADVS